MKTLEKIFFHPTSQCNLRCKYCYFSKSLEKVKNVDFSYAVEAAKLIVQKFKAGGYRTKYVIYHGGEPTLLPPETLAAICNIFNEILTEDGHHAIQTNGTLITKEYIDAFEAVADKGVALVVSVSIDGTRSINDLQRGKGVYDKAMSNVLMLKERGYRVGLFGCVTPNTLLHLPEMESWIHEIESMGLIWRFQPAQAPFDLTHEQQTKLAEWLFERGWQYAMRAMIPKNICSLNGNKCFLLRFNADGSLPFCGCERIPNLSRANWEALSIDEIIAVKTGCFSDHYESEKCSYCSVKSVCNSGCPLTRVNGLSVDCSIRKKLYELESKKRCIPVHQVVNIYKRNC